MKRKLSYQILLGLSLLLSAGCEKAEEPEEKIYPIQIFATGPWNGGESWTSWEFNQGEITLLYPNAKVLLYGSEEDYLLRKNALYEGYTNEKGMFYKEFTEPQAFWVYIEKGNLNNNRFSFNTRGNGKGCNNRIHNYVVVERSIYKEEQEPLSKAEMTLGESVFSILSPNPAKLNLTVYENGVPVEGAIVTLYFSQEAYEQDIPAYFDVEELKTSYGIYEQERLKNYMKECLERSFAQTTTEDGEAYFENLEPRQYWFKVEKEGKTNATGTFSTGKPLPDNPDLTTSLTVGIN